MKTGIIVVIALCAFFCPAESISRWDLRVTLRRYARCEGSLAPLKKYGLSEQEVFMNQIRVFLDQANYDNEQLANITQFMNTICRPQTVHQIINQTANQTEAESDYPVSLYIEVERYNSTATPALLKSSKQNRCKGIDRAMDGMFAVFKRAALNKSEPLDFSTVKFPAETVLPDSPPDAHYNLTDLVNTLWIGSLTTLDDTCNITRSITDYVQMRSSISTAQDRSQTAVPQGFVGSLLELIDRLLDPILGLQKRFYWEGSNRMEVLYVAFGDQLGNLRDGLGRGYKSTRDRLSIIFSFGSNSTLAANSTAVLYNLTVPLNMTSTSLPTTTTTSAPQVPSSMNVTQYAPVVEESLNKTVPDVEIAAAAA